MAWWHHGEKWLNFLVAGTSHDTCDNEEESDIAVNGTFVQKSTRKAIESEFVELQFLKRTLYATRAKEICSKSVTGCLWSGNNYIFSQSSQERNGFTFCHLLATCARYSFFVLNWILLGINWSDCLRKKTFVWPQLVFLWWSTIQHHSNRRSDR